jgi:hypothetical protein
VVRIEVPDRHAVAHGDCHRPPVGAQGPEDGERRVDGDRITQAGSGGDVVDGHSLVLGGGEEDAAVCAELERTHIAARAGKLASRLRRGPRQRALSLIVPPKDLCNPSGEVAPAWRLRPPDTVPRTRRP